MKPTPAPVLVAIVLTGLACTPADDVADAGTDAGRRDAGGLPDDGPPLLAGKDCDTLVPTQCNYPFPSDVWLVDDDQLPSGKRVAFGAKTLPRFYNQDYQDRTQWADSDGWSPGQALLAHFPGVSLDGLATQDTIELSIASDSSTVLIEASTGARVPHFVDLDMSTGDDEDRAFMLRPVVRLKDQTRYIVAMRKLRNAAGALLEPSPAFKALRDGSESTDPTVGTRREHYTDLFAKLAAAGVAKDDLQLAWDYTTASRDNNTRWMLHMRDDALAKVGSDGPEYRITKVTDDYNESITRRIEGEMRVPLYLNKQGNQGKLTFGADGMPVANDWAWYPFLVLIPKAAKDVPAAILAQGHGLLGRRTEGEGGYLARFAQAKNYVTITVDLVGMAEEDEEEILKLINGDLGLFRDSVDRQHQGMINQLLAMRLMTGKFKDDEKLQFNGHSAIDPALRFYRGDSQGGIMGATYMALSTDVTRGYLGEPGMPYNLLLNRSVDFDDFFAVLKLTYPTARDLQVTMGLLQMHWDRAEPTGYAPYVTSDNLPGVQQKQVLINVAIGDYQVTPLGAHVMARAMGARHLKPVNRTVFGLDEAEGPLAAGVSAMQEYAFGLPEVPKTNVPPRDKTIYLEDKDPHDEVRVLGAVFDQTDKFLREGIIQSFCTGPCDPE